MKTRDEVIKALEICTRNGKCEDCPYCEIVSKSPSACFDVMASDALRLIRGENNK